MSSEIRRRRKRNSDDFLHPLKSRRLQNHVENHHQHSFNPVLRKSDLKTIHSVKVNKLSENIPHTQLYLPRVHPITFRFRNAERNDDHPFKDCMQEERVFSADYPDEHSRIKIPSALNTSLELINGIETVTTSNLLKVRTESRFNSLKSKIQETFRLINNDDSMKSQQNNSFPKQVLKDVRNTMSNSKNCSLSKADKIKRFSVTGRENSCSEMKQMKQNSEPVKRLKLLNPVVNLKKLKLKEPVSSYCEKIFEEEILETSDVTERRERVLKNIKFKKTVDINENRSKVNTKCIKQPENVKISPIIKRNRKYTPLQEESLDKKKQNKKKLNVSFKEHDEFVEHSYDSWVPSSDSDNEDSVTEVRVNTPVMRTRSQTQRLRAHALENESVGTGRCFSKTANSLKNCGPSVKEPKLQKRKKRMTKLEAMKKTEIVNLTKKSLECITVANNRNSSPEGRKRPRRIATRNAKYTLESDSMLSNENSSAMERKTPISKYLHISDRSENRVRTPYVSLNRLNESDVSSYKITPLREDRLPMRSKSEVDYGIDDVNTDDSTDDDEFPRKELPVWAEEARANSSRLYNIQRQLSRSLIRKWMFPPKHKNSLKTFLFS